MKIAIILLLGSVLVIYTNCGQPGALTFQSSAISGNNLVAFEQTIYPITRARCVSCHTTTQPLHASEDVSTAYKAVMENYKINVANIPASRLVAKLRDENHNCWSDCSQNALEMQRAIELWDETVNPHDEIVPPPPVDNTIYTPETDTIQMELNDSTNAPKTNSVQLNIEAAMLQSPMELVRSSDGDYLAVTSTGTSLANNAANAGHAYFNFQVPASGTYRIWALSYAPSVDDNRFFVSVYNSLTPTVSAISGGLNRTWDIAVGTRFEWKQVSNFTMNLAPNTNYTLDLRQGEDGAQVSSFIITSDTNFNGSEIGDYFGKTLVFDMSQRLNSPGSQFLIDLVDFDLYSYKLSNPRFITPSGNVYVKGIKVYVNDVYNPQHSAYTIVDKIVTPEDSILSSNTMIVLKDKGSSLDTIKFSFDQLASTNENGTGGAQGGGGGGGQTSLMAFQETVYPISRSSTYSCVTCHTATSPRHASDNVQTAHDAALGVVNFTNPGSSRIVTKMRTDRHNCGANCDQIADLYQAAIQEWKNKQQ